MGKIYIHSTLYPIQFDLVVLQARSDMVLIKGLINSYNLQTMSTFCSEKQGFVWMKVKHFFSESQNCHHIIKSFRQISWLNLGVTI